MAPLSPTRGAASSNPASPPKAASPTQRGVYSEVCLGGSSSQKASSTFKPSARAVQSQPRARRFQRKAAPSADALAAGPVADAQAAFPPSAFEPKVQCPHETRPGVTPRKIEVKRKQELYASQSIVELLEKQGVAHPPAPGSDDALSLLPLEAFDDTEFESRPPSVWLAMGTVDGVFVGLPAQGVRPAPDPDDGDAPAEWQQCKARLHSRLNPQP